MENPEELQSVIRSLLVSDPKVNKANKLFRDYEDSEGKPFPFRQLGFNSFVEYLNSIPSVVRVEPPNSYNPDVYPIISNEVSHINKLVSKQRIPTSKNTSKRSWGLSRPPPRRRPTFISPTPPTRSTYAPQPTRLPPNKGIYVSEIEDKVRKNHTTKSLTSKGMGRVNDFNFAVNTVTYELAEPQLNEASYMSQDSWASNYNDPAPNYNGPPAESDDEFDNYNLGYDDCEFFENITEEEISNYTIQRYTEGNIHSQEKVDSCTRVIKEEQLEENRLSVDNYVGNIPETMINNFRIILSKHPDGIWCRDLPEKYFEECNVPLDLLDLGYDSAIRLASSLPDVFSIKGLGFSKQDWKLYDARKMKESSKFYDNAGKASGFNKSGIYVPQAILENIKHLTVVYKIGFRSTSLQELYEINFKKVLDWKSLGFKQLEDFLEVLKDSVTIRKVADYYFILPKVTIVPLERIETVEEFEVQKEAMPFIGPDNVIKPGETIPLQELPIVKEDAKGNEPLMELELRVAEVFSPHLFHIVLDSNYNALETMMDELHKFYDQEHGQYYISMPYIQPGLICVCKYDDSWHRARVIEKKGDKAKIEYIDYGTPQTVDCSELRYLHSDYAVLPAQALCAKLIGIRPLNGDRWSTETCKQFLSMVAGKRLLAFIYCINLKKTKYKLEETVLLEMILFDTSDGQDIVFNDTLVKRKLARIAEQRDTGAIHLEEHNWNSSTSPNRPSHLVPEQETQTEVPTKLFQEQKKQTEQPTKFIQEQKKQTELPKRTSRVPPGFEKLVYNLPPGPLNDVSFPKSIHNNAQAGVNSYTSMLQAQPQQQIPLPMPTQFPVMPRQQNPNFPHMNLHGSHFYRFPPANTQYCSPYTTPLLPQANFHCGFQPNYPQPQYQFHTQQPYILPQKVEFNYNNVNVPQNNPYFNKTQSKVSNNIAGQRVNQSIPPPRVQTDSPNNLQLRFNNFYHQMISHENLNKTSVSQESTIKAQRCYEPAAVFNSKTDVTSTKTNLNVFELNEDVISKPHTPLTSSSAEVINICDRSKHDSKVSSLSNYSEKNSTFELNNKAKDEPIINETSDENLINSKLLSNLRMRSLSSTSDEHATPLENDTKTYDEKLPVKEISQPTSVHGENDQNDLIPDSWEDIDPDDTPSKAENFSQDLVDFLNADINNRQLKINLPTDNITYNNNNILHTENTTVKDHLLTPEKIKLLVNWKDGFDPDVKSISNSCSEQIDKKSTGFEKINVKNTLVQQLEIGGKCFHLIFVHNKLAVIAQEFYSQFTFYNWSTINKILDLEYPAGILLIHRVKEPALFSELNKVQFCGVTSKAVLKLGKTFISYLSDIPSVLKILKRQDKVLLDNLKMIENNFNSS